MGRGSGCRDGESQVFPADSVGGKMNEDFCGAAMRHFRDGDLLLDRGRIPNADQLFGFAAECAIKSALVALPGFVANGELAKRYREHISELWELVPLQGIQRRYGPLAVLLRALRGRFDNWSTSQRYAGDDAVAEGAARDHLDAARRLLGSVGLLGLRKED